MQKAKLLALALTGVALSQGWARAGGPAGRRAINYGLFFVNATPTGRALDALRQSPPCEMHWRFVPDDAGPGQGLDSLYYLDFALPTTNGLGLRFHSHLRPSWPKYRSWVFVQGLVLFESYTVFHQQGLKRLPAKMVVETDRIAWLKAMQHWDELGAPEDADFAKDPRYTGDANLAIRLKASVSELYELWKGDFDGFIARIDQRRRDLGYEAQTLEEYLAEAGRSPGEEKAGKALREKWRLDLAALKDSWERRRSDGFSPKAPQISEAAEILGPRTMEELRRSSRALRELEEFGGSGR